MTGQMSAFLVMLREGVEAALIVAILLGYLARVGSRTGARMVWAGTAAAAALSLVVGGILFATIGELEGAAEEITEGVIALVAVALLSWMIFWMGRQARTMRDQIEQKADEALATGGVAALTSIAFVAVLREGLESALFLISTTVGEEASGGQLLGGLIGLATAVVIGYGFYQGSRRIDLRAFFRVTGILIILFAAGLVAKGIHEFQEVGLFPIWIEHVWNLGVLDPDTTTTGRFLRSLFGWRPDPSLAMVMGYFGYLVPVGGAFVNMTRKVPAVPKQSVTVR